MTTSCTDHDHPYYDQLKSLGSREVVKFFTNNKGARMRYVSLGEALDFASWGFMNGVAYDLSPRAMVWFIRKWMSAQKPRRKIVEVLVENMVICGIDFMKIFQSNFRE